MDFSVVSIRAHSLEKITKVLFSTPIDSNPSKTWSIKSSRSTHAALRFCQPMSCTRTARSAPKEPNRVLKSVLTHFAPLVPHVQASRWLAVCHRLWHHAARCSVPCGADGETDAPWVNTGSAAHSSRCVCSSARRNRAGACRSGTVKSALFWPDRPVGRRDSTSPTRDRTH